MPAQTAYWRRFVADQPLAGRRIVVTRPEAKSLAEELERLGAEVTLVPLIEIRDAEDRGALADAVAGFSSYDWIVLTSVNGVAAVSEGLSGLAGPRVRRRRAGHRGRDPRARSRAGIRRRRGPRRTSPPASESSKASACSCRRQTSPSPQLADELRGQGAEVDVVVAYRTVLVEPPMWGILPLRIADAVVLASGSACRSLAAAGGAGGGAMLVCIGPKTAKVAREVGLRSVSSPTRRRRTASFGRSCRTSRRAR